MTGRSGSGCSLTTVNAVNLVNIVDLMFQYIYLANNCLGFFFNVEMSVSRTTPQQRFKEGGTCDSVVFGVSFLEKLLNTQTSGVVIRETFS